MIVVISILFYYNVVIIHTSLSDVVDCVWGSYGEWSSCSAACGGGTRIRTRTEDTAAANGGAACSGSATETESCNSSACPGSKILKAVPKCILNKGNYFRLQNYFYAVKL
jgi:chondroitin sulfate proteoglycan 4/CUB/sushi domain-containing protein